MADQGQTKTEPVRRPPDLPVREGETANVDLADLQGNVLRGYTYPTAAYVFLRIDHPDRARELLRGMLPQITTAEPWTGDPPPTAMQVAFTYAGLQALGVSDAILETFPPEFREGMAARAARLGDRGPSAPERWDPGLGSGEVHALVTVYAVDDERLDARRDQLHQIGQSSGSTTVLFEQRAEALPGGRDHFGFIDGISQPAIEGSGVTPRPGDGHPTGKGRWRALATGDFVFGYVDEDKGIPAAPAAPFDRNATFMVFRKLATNVAGFRSYLEEKGKAYPGGPEMLAAKIVGRWRDGTPLELSPDRPDPAISGDPNRINDFTYEPDDQGLRCPLGAHIRRANPRDSREFYGGELTRRHRIIRRGRSYGPPLAEGALEDDGQERGLAFVCFCTSIERQFETIQAFWVDDGDALGVGKDRDFLIGEPDDENDKMTIPGNPPFFLHPQPSFTECRGGEYLFQPSIGALRWLAEGNS